MRTHDQKWLIKNALFSCCNEDCKVTQSFHYGELAVAPTGAVICEMCWEYNNSGTRWFDLPKFDPFGIEQEAGITARSLRLLVHILVAAIRALKRPQDGEN